MTIAIQSINRCSLRSFLISYQLNEFSRLFHEEYPRNFQDNNFRNLEKDILRGTGISTVVQNQMYEIHAELHYNHK